MKWLVSIHRIDAEGIGFNDNWGGIEAEDEMGAINEALACSLEAAAEQGTHLVSVHIGTPRQPKHRPSGASQEGSLGEQKPGKP